MPPETAAAPADAAARFGPAEAGTPSSSPLAIPLEDRIWSALACVNDPELPLGIVDLGLIYGVRVFGERVEVDLTHTALGCPAMEMMREDVEVALLALPGITEVDVRTVWDPPWTKARLTARGRVMLKAFGIGL